MMSQDSFFELVSKVSTENKTPNPLLDQSMDLLGKIEQQMETAINHSGAQQRSELNSKLHEVIDETMLQVHFPMLADHYNFMVACPNRVDLKLLELFVQRIPAQLKQTFNSLRHLKSPVVFYHSDNEVDATVYNLVDNNITLDSNELCNFLKLGAQSKHTKQTVSTKSNPSSASSKAALASANSLAKLCAIPLKFKDEAKHINVICVNTHQRLTDKTLLQLLNLSQRVLVAPNAKTRPWYLGSYPIQVSVYSDSPQSQDVVNEYIAKSLKVLASNGQSLVSIKECSRQQLQSSIKDMNTACDNLNIKAQILEIDNACSNVINHSLSKSKQRLESLNNFLVQSGASEPFVQQQKSQEVNAIDQYNATIQQNSSVLQGVYDSLGKLEELFEQRGCQFKEPDCLSAGAIKAWRHIFELGAQSNDISLMQRSLKYRAASDDVLVYLQQLYLNKVQGLAYKTALQDTLQQCSSFYSDDEYRHTLLRLLDFDVLNQAQDLLAHISREVPHWRRSSQENFLLAQNLFARNNNKVSHNAQKLFEVALHQGDERAIEYLVEPYLQEAKKTRNSNKLQDLARTFHPKAAYAYSTVLGLKQFHKKYQYLIIAACQSYQPALEEYVSRLYKDVLNATHPLAPHMQVRAEQALSIYHNGKFDPTTSAIRQGRLLCILERGSEALPFLQQAADKNNDYACLTLGNMYLYGKNGVAKDLQQAKFYLQKANAGYANVKHLLAKIEAGERRSSNSYKSSSSYKSYSYGGGGGGGSMCFITTATCADQGKPDDCAELTMFRKFRDEILLNTDMGQKLVQEYYRIAPTIVTCIEQDPERKAIFARIYDKYITPAYAHLLNKDYEQAREMYISCVLRLAARYGIEVHDPNLLEARESVAVKHDSAKGEDYLEL